MKRGFFLGLAAVWVNLTALQAQQPSATPALPPLPAPPLIHQPEGFAKWQVAIVYSAAKGGPAPTGKKEANRNDQTDTVTRTDQIMERETALGDGRKRVWWRSGKVETEFRSDSPIPQFALVTSVPNFFPGLGWVKASNYAAVETVQARKCYVFRDKVPVTEQFAWQGFPYVGEPPKVDAVALVDMATQLPISVTIGNETRTFQYMAPPAAQLSLPPEVASLVSKVNAEAANTPRPRPRP